jgi:hypothetical protein
MIALYIINLVVGLYYMANAVYIMRLNLFKQQGLMIQYLCLFLLSCFAAFFIREDSDFLSIIVVATVLISTLAFLIIRMYIPNQLPNTLRLVNLVISLVPIITLLYGLYRYAVEHDFAAWLIQIFSKSSTEAIVSFVALIFKL